MTKQQVELQVGEDSSPRPLGPLEQIEFPGDVPTHLTMTSSSGRDLNLMWDRTRVTGAVSMLKSGETAELRATTSFLLALKGPATVNVNGDEYILEEHDGVRFEGDGAISVQSGIIYAASLQVR